MDLALGLLDLHDLAELGRLRGIALADCFSVGLKDAERLVGEMRVAVEEARSRLRADAADPHLGPLKGVTFSSDPGGIRGSHRGARCHLLVLLSFARTTRRTKLTTGATDPPLRPPP